jgi:hypothetical protein
LIRDGRLQLTARLVLAVVLCTLGVPASPAAETPADAGAGAALSLTHDAVACVVAGRHPLIEADFAPEPSAQGARVYFHSSLSDTFYYVEMKGSGGHFVGTLPRPEAEAGPVTYYVEGLAFDHTQARTGEIRARVVAAGSECEGRLAESLPGTTPVRVFSLGGNTAFPPGFGGVGSVVATTAGVAGTGATVGLAAPPTVDPDGSHRRKVAAIVLGAAAIGLATAIVVSGEEPPPASPSR